MVFREAEKWTMNARWQGETHRIELNGKLDYDGPLFSARLDPDGFKLEHIEATAGIHSGDTLSLEACVTMYVLLNGLRQSLPHLPAALSDEIASLGRISHPGYSE